MKLAPFKLEEFFKKYEFSAKYVLCGSDAESWKLQEILEMADGGCKKLWDSLSLGYTECPGLPLLRKEISKYPVFTFAGAEEGIYCLMQSLLKPNDHVIVIEPCYQSLKALPESLGCQVTGISCRFTVEELEKAFRPDTKLLILNYPHNPTGALLEPEVFEKAIQLARARGTYIFSDEVYRGLEFDEKERLPSIVDAYEKGIALNVMSKAYGLAGLRIGWLVSQDGEVLEKAGSYKLYTSICNSAPSEILALIALRAKEKILKRNREIVLNNLKLLDDFMERYAKIFSWERPQGGTVALVRFLLDMPIEKFAEELVEKTGVLIMPGSVFELPGNYFRIGFGKKNMIEALNRIF